MSGKWGKGRYGLQFVVENFIEIVPKNKEGIVGYLSSGLINGIGEKTAEAIFLRFGNETLEVMEKTKEKLLEIKGITENKLQTIIESYDESRNLQELMTLLMPFKITHKRQ